MWLVDAQADIHDNVAICCLDCGDVVLALASPDGRVAFNAVELVRAIGAHRREAHSEEE